MGLTLHVSVDNHAVCFAGEKLSCTIRFTNDNIRVLTPTGGGSPASLKKRPTSSSTTTTLGVAEEEETLLWGFIQVVGSFLPDESMVDMSVFRKLNTAGMYRPASAASQSSLPGMPASSMSKNEDNLNFITRANSEGSTLMNPVFPQVLGGGMLGQKPPIKLTQVDPRLLPSHHQLQSQPSQRKSSLSSSTQKKIALGILQNKSVSSLDSRDEVKDPMLLPMVSSAAVVAANSAMVEDWMLPIFTTPPSILFCDLTLKAGQSQSCSPCLSYK